MTRTDPPAHAGPEHPERSERTADTEVLGTPAASDSGRAGRAGRSGRAGGSGRSSQAAAEFDDLLARSWRPLLLQVFAVCGDPASARAGLRQAFVETWQRWGRTSPDDAEGHVRQQAMSRATSLARSPSRGASSTPEQQATLSALHDLPYDQRVAVVLACLTDLPLESIGREIDATPADTGRVLDLGLDRTAHVLARPVEALPTRLRELEPAVRGSGEPTGAELRRRGVRRTRVFLAAGAAAAVVLVVVAGFLVQQRDPEPTSAPRQLGPSVTAGLLLQPANFAPVAPASRWRTVSTTNNTSGSGLNVPCQTDRFADPQGLRTYVRTFGFSGQVERSATQTMELSRTRAKAHDGYAAALGWFAGCDQAQTQLVSTYAVSGLADEATMMTFRAQGATRSVFAVGIARTGNITTWTAVTADSDTTAKPATLSAVLTSAVRRACESRAAGRCPSATQKPTVTAVAPPPSGEQAGMLATVDLPPIGSIQRPWIGTEADAVAATNNAAATGCDRTSFAQARANPIRSRTYLIPDAPVPPRFGITETYGRFANPAQAKALLRQITTRMDQCESKDLGAEISARAASRAKATYPFVLWRLQSKISQSEAITYWMGAVQVGPYVAQVGFVPGNQGQDVSAETFEALIKRARDRLVEVATAAQSSPSGSPSSSPSGSPSGSPSATRAAGASASS